MNEADLIAQQDQQRTSRAFISFLSTAMGVDQALPGTDGSASNAPAQYQTVSPYGVAVEGKPVSNQQGLQLSWPIVIVAAVLVGLVASGHIKV